MIFASSITIIFCIFIFCEMMSFGLDKVLKTEPNCFFLFVLFVSSHNQNPAAEPLITQKLELRRVSIAYVKSIWQSHRCSNFIIIPVLWLPGANNSVVILLLSQGHESDRGFWEAVFIRRDGGWAPFSDTWSEKNLPSCTWTRTIDASASQTQKLHLKHHAMHSAWELRPTQLPRYVLNCSLN